MGTAGLLLVAFLAGQTEPDASIQERTHFGFVFDAGVRLVDERFEPSVGLGFEADAIPGWVQARFRVGVQEKALPVELAAVVPLPLGPVELGFGLGGALLVDLQAQIETRFGGFALFGLEWHARPIFVRFDFRAGYALDASIFGGLSLGLGMRL